MATLVVASCSPDVRPPPSGPVTEQLLKSIPEKEPDWVYATKEIKDNLDPDGEIEKAADLDNTVRETMNETKADAVKSAAAEPKSAQTDTALNETIQGAPAKSEGAAADTVKS